jgi:hypothetical protein
MIFSGLLTLIKNAGKVFQVNFNNKTTDKVRNLTPYGLFCHPPKNSKVVLIQDKNKTYYGIAYLDEVIPTLKENEVVVGNFVIGSIVKYDEDGNINITCKKDTIINIDNDEERDVGNDYDLNITNNATITAGVNITINANTTCIVNSPSISLLSGGVGSVVITSGGTIIDGKQFLTHIHSGVTPGVGNTGGVV